MGNIFTTHWNENKPMTKLVESILPELERLRNEHGDINGLDRINIIFTKSDKGKNKYNMLISYPKKEK